MEEKDIITTGVENQDIANPENNNAPAEEHTSATAKTDRNAFFADQRRKQQLDKARADNARLQQQIDTAHRAMEILSGLEGANPQPVSEPSPDFTSQLNSVNSQLERYRQIEAQRMMDSDLAEIQAIDPAITSIADLPDIFLAMRFNPVAPMGASQAYMAAQAIIKQSRQPKPASAGSIASTGGAESEFFTSEQLDRLTPKMLDDKKTMEKALRSMARLKKERG